MPTVTCPYFNGDYSKCNFYDTHQDGYHKEAYCLSCDDNWKRCANYEKSDYNQKATRKLRTNPDL